MAMYTVLRRATAAVVPLAARRAVATSSSRTFHSALSVKLLLNKEINPFVPSRSFSNAVANKPVADDNLVQVLQNEIECAIEDDQSAQVEIPHGFPFEIEDNPGERTIQLKRQYEDETITVQVEIPTVGPGNEDDDADDNEKNDSESSIPLVVNVFKGNGVCLEFGVTAFSDEVSIDSLSIKKPDESEDELVYEGPEFTDLDENLQKAFLKYLEVRGITASTTNFLQEYMFNKDNKEYLVWLENLKSFVEK
ncbi:uncharacterized protein At2g39795, mitochondrial-like [Trifolium pratense]|uniref:uncharacterized protein At2g39795, mitochondrial-like n=1 Tax=Trifolium pratense TaxID=57577 RepID=UPI001E6950C3|nr:uncharacterized protein At2g39795, mitochondrial-like [Trifolium pratense]